MANPVGMMELFAAVKQRWADKGCAASFPGGISTQPVPETARTADGSIAEAPQRPYVVIEPGPERGGPGSRKFDFTYCDFKTTVAADTWDDPEAGAGFLVGVLKDALQYAPLEFPEETGARMESLINGDVAYRPEGTYWLASVGFTAWIFQPADRKPR